MGNLSGATKLRSSRDFFSKGGLGEILGLYLGRSSYKLTTLGDTGFRLWNKEVMRIKGTAYKI